MFDLEDEKNWIKIKRKRYESKKIQHLSPTLFLSSLPNTQLFLYERKKKIKNNETQIIWWFLINLNFILSIKKREKVLVRMRSP